MRRCAAILLFGLALWAEPASAYQIKLYRLTVSVHQAVHPKLTKDEIVGILKGASDILQGHADSAILQGHTGTALHNSCPVGFELKGPVQTFASAPAVITKEEELEAAHAVPADVKVVQTITFCVGEARPHGVPGCAWRRYGKRTVIVARDGFPPLLGSPQHDRGIGPVLWAHEFGHTTDLLHRYDKGILSPSENLMTPCDLEAFSQSINDDECAHFRRGPVTRYRQGGDACQTSLQPRND